MTRPLTRPAPRDDSDPFRLIADRAAAADAGDRDLGEDMALLHAEGILETLASPPGRDLAARVTLLRRLGRANLSVGRLAEGHMNALELVRLYARPAQVEAHVAAAASGRLFGVWGAEGDPPVRIAKRRDGRVMLQGAKRFCSGLGVVATAVAPVAGEDGPQLVIADVTVPARQDASGWDTSGMRATASGTYDFDGVEAELLGAPGDYLREPHFEGGVWRYAALHAGAVEALAEGVIQAVAASHPPSPHQLHRAARIALQARTARLLVEDAARQAAAAGEGGPAAPDAAAALSLLAREGVEQACLEALAIADRSLGTRAFVRGHPVERIRRDLAFFLRQADLDGKLERSGRWLCGTGGPVGEAWP